MLEHGVETGIIKRLPSGEFIEVHQPLGPVDEHGHGALEYAGAPVPKRMNRITSPGRKIKGFLRRVPDPGEAPDTGTAAHRDLDELEGVPEDRQLAGRPKDPDL